MGLLEKPATSSGTLRRGWWQTQGQSRQQASRSGGSCHRDCFGQGAQKAQKEVPEVGYATTEQVTSSMPGTNHQSHAPRLQTPAKERPSVFVSCFNTKAFCEQGHLWYWKNAFLCVLYPTNSLLRNHSLFYCCVLLIKGIAPVSHLVCFTDSHPWFLNQETRICN